MTFNHLSDINCQDFINLLKNVLYSFLMIDTTLDTTHFFTFQIESFRKN